MVCLFYAVHYQQGEGTAVVLRAWFVRMNIWTYLPRCAYSFSAMKLVRVKKWKSKNKPKTKERQRPRQQYRTMYTIGQWLGKKITKNSWKPSIIAIFSCTCAIIPQKQVRCPFGQSRSCGVCFHFIWACTCFWVKMDQVYLFLIIAQAYMILLLLL